MSSYVSQEAQVAETASDAHDDGAAYLDAIDNKYATRGKGVKQKALDKRSQLGWASVVCIIVNRMIGSGIFITPSSLMQLTQSAGITMLFWAAGAVTTLCGTLVFMEYGLTSPRFTFVDHAGETKLALPRSGGDLFYLKDVLRKPPVLAVCLYGIAFVLLGNIATNSMAFGVRVLQAAGQTGAVNEWAARGIAIAVVVFTCALHSLWRIGGIYINNILACIKVAILLMMFITGCLTWGGVFERNADATPNLTAPDAFKNPSQDAYAFAQAYLSIVFAFGGFNQANYILGEVRNPKKYYKWPAFLAVFGTCILYFLVNIAYMLVVPAEDQKSGVDVATRFFELTYGSLSKDGKGIATRILSGFMAISALGNLIVMTYTAARVKQEIAKEGILPGYNFLSNNYHIFGGKYDPVPLGALVLHGAVSILLILATAKVAPLQAYRILVGLYSYTIDAIFGVVLCIGVFVLRARSKSFAACSFLPGWISMLAATLYGLSMAFPVVVSYVPPSAQYLRYYASNVPWYFIATVSWCCVALGALWFVGFRWLYPLKHPGQQIVVERVLLIGDDDTIEEEKINIDWVPSEQGMPSIREEAQVTREAEYAMAPMLGRSVA